VRIAVIDGTSALDLGTGAAQAAWLDKVLADNLHPWSIVLIHQPFYSPRAERDNEKLVQQVLPVIRRHKVDLVLQGHDHTYGRRGDADTRPRRCSSYRWPGPSSTGCRTTHARR
jgi:3',5'-cyclic AMP phosphodiesterase CpdA